MTPTELRDLCMSLPQAIETFPFDDETSVFKTAGNGKIFAIAALAKHPLVVSVKCDPEESRAHQAAYPGITPGYHLNKRHWITIAVNTDVVQGGRQGGQAPQGDTQDDQATNSGVPDHLVEQLVRDSHALVRPRAARARRALPDM